MCRSAISDFEADQRSYADKRHEMQILTKLQSSRSGPPECTLVKQPLPLEPKSAALLPYLSPHALQHSVSPYYMSQDDPKKYFMSGYTGFVPKSRKYMGKGYPAITNIALKDHTNDEQRFTAIRTQPVIVHRSIPHPAPAPKIYPINTGLVPNYTGHIPGKMFTTSLLVYLFVFLFA